MRHVRTRPLVSYLVFVPAGKVNFGHDVGHFTLERLVLQESVVLSLVSDPVAAWVAVHHEVGVLLFNLEDACLLSSGVSSVTRLVFGHLFVNCYH